AHIAITGIIKDFGDTLREGVVIKDPQMILPSVKYTSSLSNCADLRYAFEFYNDFGRDFFFGRVCREAFQSVEWEEDETQMKKRCQQLGESILLPMVGTIKKKKAGERISENVQIRVKSMDTVKEFEEYLRLVGVDAVFEEPQKIGEEYLVRIKRINRSTNDKTESILSGQMWS
ncbi:MAG: RNA ligase, partial [Candidatus Methanoperedens sp.]